MVLKKEREGEYVLISDLQSGRAIQKEFRDKRDQLQLDKEFALTNIKLYSGLFTRFQTLLKNYSRKVADNVVAPLLEAHLVQTIITQKTVKDSQMGKNRFYSSRDCKVA